MPSRPLRLSTRSFIFLSSSAYSSASWTMRSISSSDKRPFSAVIVIFSAFPVPLSSAPTWRIPFASISKVTSICATRRRRDPAELELAKHVVVLGHGTLSLVHLNHHRGLVVLVGRECLRLLGRDDAVALDELGHDPADSLNSKRQRCYVKQQDVLSRTLRRTSEDTALDGRAIRHSLVRVNSAVRLLTVEVVLEQLLHLRDTGGPADQHHLVNLRLGEAAVGHYLADRAHRLLEEVNVEVLEAGTCESLGKVNSVEERLNLEAGLVLRRQGTLHALDLAAELLDGSLVLRHVLLVLLLEQLHEVGHDTLVKVLTAKMCVTICRQHLENTVVDCQERHVEGAAAEVKDKDVLLPTLLVKAIGNGSRSRLIDDAHHAHARDGTRVLGSLTLSVVEVRRHSHHRVLHLLVKDGLSGRLHLLQHHGTDLLRRELLPLAVNIHHNVRAAVLVDDLKGPELHVLLNRLVLEVAANEALGVVDRVLRVDRGLILGAISDEALAALCLPGHIRRCDTVTLVVGEDLDLALLVHAHA